MSHKGGSGGLSGILIVDKPEGVTSHDVVSRARRSLGFKKIGHAGTLDPFATGLLVLLLGEGTKLSNFLMEGSKTYLATIRFGEKRDSADLTGEVIERAPFDNISLADVQSALVSFEGETSQLPPMYSALKKKGVPLYRLARKGVEVERRERPVFIESIKVVAFDLPHLEIEVRCSKGTYVRTLAEDIAGKLGTVGHLVRLRRTESGALSLKDALSFEDLGIREKAIDSALSLADSISSMSKIVVSAEGAGKIRNGSRLLAGMIESFEMNGKGGDDLARVMTADGALISIVTILAGGREFKELPPDQEVGKSVRVFNER